MSDAQTPARPADALRVLYVEDQPFMRDMAADYLRGIGHAVDTACDGIEGWQKFSQAVYDLVITDLEMPNLDGIGLIRRLRESRQPVRIIVHSSALNSFNLTVLRDLSVQAVLLKGVPAETLRGTIEQVARMPASLPPPTPAAAPATRVSPDPQ
ncbi:MAG: response regulator [Lacunisphaera sp.]